MKCWYLIDTICDRPPGICEGCERYEDWRKERDGMTEERPIDRIVKQIETLIASMPYDANLDDEELLSEIRKNKSFLLEGLKKGISEERIFRVVR